MRHLTHEETRQVLLAALKHCPASERDCVICGTHGCAVLGVFSPNDPRLWRKESTGKPTGIAYGVCQKCLDVTPKPLLTELCERGIAKRLSDGKSTVILGGE